MSPCDNNAYFGPPTLFTPKDYDEIHISVVFTWDIDRGRYLADQWKSVCNIVRIGGPAFDDPGGDFTPGIYVRHGVTITSRGCPKQCDFCFVPKREGKLRELPIVPGRIVQDNNLLACSKSHIEKVFQMLKTQRQIAFPGGLDIFLINDDVIEKLRSVKILYLWLSYDRPEQKERLEKVIQKLRRYFKQRYVRVYVLIGYEGDTIVDAESRLRYVYEIGGQPFAMRYRLPSQKFEDSFVYRERSWNLLTRIWTRPALMKRAMRMKQ